MSIATSLTALQQAKTDIASAITEMGGTVNPGDGMTSFADDIKTIPKGGEGFVRDPEAPNLDLLRQPGCELAHGSGYNVVFVSIKIETQLPSNYNGRFNDSTPTSAKEVIIQNDGSYTIVKDNVLNSQYIDMSIFSPGWHVLRFEYNYSVAGLEFYSSYGYAPLGTSIVEVYTHCQSVRYVSCGNHVVMIDSAPTSGSLSFSRQLEYIDFDNCDFSKITNVNFSYCPILHELNLQGYDFSSATSLSFGDMLSPTVNLKNCDFSSVTSIQSMFSSNCNLRYVDMSGAIFKNLSNSGIGLTYCYSLQEADLRFDLCGSDFSINLSYQVGRLLFDSSCQAGKIQIKSCGSLRELAGFPHANDDVDFTSTSSLTAESLMLVISQLNTVSETKTLNIGATNLAKLTEDQIAIAQDKGWTVT